MEDSVSVDDNGGELHYIDDNGQVIAGVAQYVGDVGGCTCGGIEFYAVQFLHGDDQFYECVGGTVLWCEEVESVCTDGVELGIFCVAGDMLYIGDKSAAGAVDNNAQRAYCGIDRT